MVFFRVALDDAERERTAEGVGGLCSLFLNSWPLSLPTLLMMHEAQRALSKLRRGFASNWPQVRRPALVWFWCESLLGEESSNVYVGNWSQDKCLCVRQAVAR